MAIISFVLVNPKMELHDLIEQNNRLLLLMEHFNTGFTVADMTIEEICNSKGINPLLFASLCNLYNGYDKQLFEPQTIDDFNQLIDFLENSHRYYLDEMYPEIKHFIKKLSEINDTADIKMLDKFFESYFFEVKKHLEYEQKKVFPLFRLICNGGSDIPDLKKSKKISHSDIETKLADLKNLLLKHIKLVDKDGAKRKLLSAIFEFQFDLTIHSIIEDKILMPSIMKICK